MTARESTQEQTQPQYMSKKVVINGQTVTLYSLNGVTWLSTPDQLPDTMARLDNTRILLHDPKAGEVAPAPAPAPKATAARYRMRGPKPRPILQPDGTLAPVVEREPVAATETQVQITHQEIQVVRDPKKDTRTAFSKHLDGKKSATAKEPAEKVKAAKDGRSNAVPPKTTAQKSTSSSKGAAKVAVKIVAPIANSGSSKKVLKGGAKAAKKSTATKKTVASSASKKSTKAKK